MTTVVSVLFSDVIPLRNRGTWQGYLNIIYAFGAGAGAPLGGIIADYLSWRWAFLAQAPLCLVAFIAVFFVLKLPKPDQSHWKTKLGRIDFVGAFVLLCAVAALLVGLDRGSNVSWNDKITIISSLVSLPLFLIFVLVEVYVASEPFAPGHVIFERSLVAAFLCNFFSFSGYLAAIFYIPLYLQAVYGMSATRASLLLIPNIIAGVSGSLFAGFYMQRTGHYYWLTVLCYTFLVLGMVLVVLFSGTVTSFIPGMVIGMVISGFSNGIGVTSSLIGLIANAGHSDQAIATACSYLFRSLGSVFGVSISAMAVNQTLRSSLRHALSDNADADKIAERVRQSLEFIKTLEPGTREIVRECYAKSTRLAFSLQVVMVLGAAVSAWWIREKKLS
jgi:predicted MFS family arabinose efflux permease